MMDRSGVPGWTDALRQLPELDAAEERALIVRAQAGDASARRRVVESQLPKVLRYALRLSRYPVPLAELVSEGTIGVLEALDRYDVSRGLRFSTYSSQWVRNYVLERAVLEHSPYWSLRGAFRTKYWFRLRKELAQAHVLGLDPTQRVTRIAERLELQPETVRRLLEHLGARSHPCDPGLEDDDTPSGVRELPSEGPDPEEIVSATQQQTKLRAGVDAALAPFAPREREIIERRLMAEEPLTYAQIGEVVGLSRQRVHQIETKCRAGLRQRLEPLRRLG